MASIPFGAVLRERNFSRLWFGQIISSLGDRFYVFAIFTVVLGLRSADSSGELFSRATLCGIMPGLLFAPLYGWIVDNYSRRWVMVWADLIRVLLTLSLIFIWTDAKSMTGVYVIIFFMGALNGLFIPARQAALPQLITGDKLVSANALISSIGIIANLVGIPLAQLCAVVFNPAYCFDVNAFGFIISAFCVLRIDADLAPDTKSGLERSQKMGFWTNALRGVKVLQDSPGLVPLILTVTIFSISSGVGLPTLVQHVVKNVTDNFLPAAVQWAQTTLHPYFPLLKVQANPLAVGLVMGSLGVGMAIGIGLCGLFEKLSHWKALPYLALSCVGVGLYGLSQTHVFLWALLGAVFVGIPCVLVLNLTDARLQSEVVNENRGRLFALKNLCTATGFIIGLSINISGWMLKTYGTAAIFQTLGILTCLIGLLLVAINPATLTTFWTARLPEGTNSLARPS